MALGRGLLQTDSNSKIPNSKLRYPRTELSKCEMCEVRNARLPHESPSRGRAGYRATGLPAAGRAAPAMGAFRCASERCGGLWAPGLCGRAAALDEDGGLVRGHLILDVHERIDAAVRFENAQRLFAEGP